MSAPLCSCDTYGGSGMKNICSQAAEQSRTITNLRKQVEKLTAERDEWKNDAINGGNAGYLREQLAALAEQNEKMRKVLVEAKSMAGHPDNIAIINSAISLPNLATPVLNRILAEGMRMAAEICEEIDNDEHLEMSIVCAEAIRAKADEMEQSK